VSAEGNGRLVQLWDVATGQELRSWRLEDEGQVGAFILAPDLQTVVIENCGLVENLTTSKKTTLKTWNLTNGDIKDLFQENLGGVERWMQSIEFAPDGKTLALGISSAHDPNTILTQLMKYFPIEADNNPASSEVLLWDVTTGRQKATIPNCRMGVFSSDGRTFAGTPANGSPIQIWDCPPRKYYVLIFGISAAAGCLVGIVCWLLTRGKQLARAGHQPQ
jgi:WD40 repeat protein